MSDLLKYLPKKFCWESILPVVNAYLFYAFLSSLVLSSDVQFITLARTLPLFIGILLVFALSLIFYLAERRLKWCKMSETFVFLMAAYLFVVLIKSPSLLIDFGFVLLGFAVYVKLSWDKTKWRQLIPFSLLLTFPRLLYLIYHPVAMDLKRFVIDNSSWNINRIWVIISVMLYIVCAYILCQHLPDSFIEKLLSNRHLARCLYILVGIVCIAYIAYICLVSAYKVTTLSVSTFDIGIFTQMFESMRRDLSQITTLERDKFLSHFNVHISPIYYLMLPIYHLLPYGETLEVLQVLIVFSGLIPLYLILRKMDFPQFTKPLALLWFLVTPAMTTAGAYHLHENCFLVPLLLWLIYANMRQWKWQLGLIVLLTLMIKEDAFIYVVSVGLYFLLQKRFDQSQRSKLTIVFSQLIFPMLYFAISLFILNHFGEGVMAGRFDIDNFLPGGQKGLLKVLENIFLNPTYTFASFFTQAKLKYIFILFLTQAFLPILQKEWVNYLLLIPLVVINLLSNWLYQVDFGFQYSYGTNVLVLFMSLLALEAIWQSTQAKETFKLCKTVLSFLSVAVLMSVGVLYTHINGWSQDMLAYRRDSERYDDVHYVLSTIDSNKRVLAYHSYTVDLRRVRELYDVFYHNDRKFDNTIDLVVVPRSVTESNESTESKVVAIYNEKGYKEAPQSTKQVLVLEKP